MVCTGLFPLDRAGMGGQQFGVVGLLQKQLFYQQKSWMWEQTILKVEAVKIMSFHQVAQGLRLKGSQPRITNLPVTPNTTSATEKRAFKIGAGGLKLTRKSQSLRC